MSDSDITTTNPVKRVIAKTIRPSNIVFGILLAFLITLVFRESGYAFIELLGFYFLFSLALDSLYEVYLRVRK